MDYIDSFPALGLIGIFLGNELMLAWAIESYSMAYIPMRVVVIPDCSAALIAVSVVRWWNSYRDGKSGKQLAMHFASLVIGGSVWAFQWLASLPLFMD